MLKPRTILGGIALIAAVLGPSRARAAAANDEEGFKPIFNGKDLTGWDGDPRLWSVRDGVLCGETTDENQAAHNTFLIWRGGALEDFELRLSFRIARGNSGVQLRSTEFEKWRIRGYQTEVAPTSGAMGLFYDEARRGVLATAGRRVRITPKGEKRLEEQFALAKEVQKYYKENDWNELTILGRENHLIQKINGVPFSEFTDEQSSMRDLSGLLALQIHTGPPMRVEFKDIRLKVLEKQQWTALFNGTDLTSWTIPGDGWYDGHGKVAVEDGAIRVGEGMPMTGIGWKGEFPKENYEVTLEGMRASGYDFWCGMTFPVGDSFVTLICGGWGGTVVGLSNVDGYNASENETSLGVSFDDKKWYRVRVRVDAEKIQVWLNDETIINAARKGREFSVWDTQMPIKPLGLSTYETGAAWRDIKLRRLKP